MKSSVTLASAISVTSSLCRPISVSSRSNGPSKLVSATAKARPGRRRRGRGVGRRGVGSRTHGEHAVSRAVRRAVASCRPGRAFGHASRRRVISGASAPSRSRSDPGGRGRRARAGAGRGRARGLARIDLTRRRAACHPHVGALDVAPIVYLDDEPRGAACAEALRRRGPARGGAGLPVYLYGDARRRAHARRAAARRAAESRAVARRSAPDFGPRDARSARAARCSSRRARRSSPSTSSSTAPASSRRAAIAAAIREGGARACPASARSASGCRSAAASRRSRPTSRTTAPTPLAALLEAVARARARARGASWSAWRRQAAFAGSPDDVPIRHPPHDRGSAGRRPVGLVSADGPDQDASAGPSTAATPPASSRRAAAPAASRPPRSARPEQAGRAQARRDALRRGRRRGARAAQPRRRRGVLFVVVLVLLFDQKSAPALALGAFVLLFYIPLGYYTDQFVYRRKLKKAAREVTLMDVRMFTVGPVQENCFLFRRDGSDRALIVDPGEEADRAARRDRGARRRRSRRSCSRTRTSTTSARSRRWRGDRRAGLLPRARGAGPARTSWPSSRGRASARTSRWDAEHTVEGGERSSSRASRSTCSSRPATAPAT